MPAQSDENGVGRSEEPFVSRLDKGRERFLSHVIVNALELGRRTPTDFIRHFPPAEIMKGLELRPHLRAKILEPSTGVRHKIALKKSAMSAGDDLQIAMDEGEATAEQLQAHCRERLADFKVPKVIHITKELPRTPTGKVQRRHVAATFLPG